jgi:aerobic-type carbon monoxide dehydrogenase small subunit (CoxS/CutS family)
MPRTKLPRSEAERDEDAITIEVNGATRRAQRGITVAAALLNAGVWSFRRAEGGDVRGPLCGMGICHECRVTIDGTPHRRACLVPIIEGMVVRTGE